MSQKTKSFFVRFFKGFIAGGASSVMVQLSAGITLQSMADVNNALSLVFMAFLTGGLLAVEKMLTWQETLQ